MFFKIASLISFLFFSGISSIPEVMSESQIRVEANTDAIFGQYLKLSCKGSIDRSRIQMVQWKKNGNGFSWYYTTPNAFIYYTGIKGIKPKFMLDDIYSIVLADIDYETSSNYSCALAYTNTNVNPTSDPKEIKVRKFKESMKVKIITKMSNKYFPSQYLIINRPMDLSCLYEGDSSKIEAITLKKDGVPFMKYNTKSKTYSVGKKVDGVEFDLSQSSDGKLHLLNTYTNTSGMYECEVDTETEMIKGSRIVVLNEKVNRLHYIKTFNSVKGGTRAITVGFEFELKSLESRLKNTNVKEIIWYKNFVPFYRHIIGEDPQISMYDDAGLKNLKFLSDYHIKDYYVVNEIKGHYMIEIISETKENPKYVSEIGLAYIKPIADNRTINLKPMNLNLL